MSVSDCNECKYINMTECEQDTISDGKIFSHRCTFYNEKVLHRTTSKHHSSYLYPCESCKNANYESFKEKISKRWMIYD